MKRRHFLRWGAGGMLLGGAGLVRSAAWVPDFSAIRLEATGLDARHWATVAAVQEHLLPAEKHAPGAKDVNATAWLQWVLSDPSVDDRQRRFFRKGAEEVHGLSLRLHGKPFQALSPADREALLRRYEEHNPLWLRELLNYIMEALLTDPVYGGNTGQVGWKWLGHRPGYRRPPAGKRYFLL
ncbi:gluconate 2-dehydrogenase subunit 3 family protein [Thiolapillus sp.]